MGLDFYQYKGVFSQIDTTLELTINHPSQSWTIYGTFFFDLQGRCYAFLNRRCDSEGHKQFQQFLADGSYGWKIIGTNKYLSKYSVGELLEVFDDNDCLTYKRTKLNLTRKQYKEMKDAIFLEMTANIRLSFHFPVNYCNHKSPFSMIYFFGFRPIFIKI